MPIRRDEQSDVDEDLEIWDQFTCAVRWLRRERLRPELTYQLAVQEALGGWLAEQAALHHHEEPFPPE